MFPRNPKPTSIGLLGPIDWPNFRPQSIPCLDGEVVARANPKFARANSNREMVARADSCPLERLHPESGSLERTQSSLERMLQNFTPLIQRVVRSSEHIRISATLSLLHSFLHSLPQPPAITLDLLSTPHSSFNPHINAIPPIHN